MGFVLGVVWLVIAGTGYWVLTFETKAEQQAYCEAVPQKCVNGYPIE
jgi:hypothetical protein